MGLEFRNAEHDHDIKCLIHLKAGTLELAGCTLRADAVAEEQENPEQGAKTKSAYINQMKDSTLSLDRCCFKGGGLFPKYELKDNKKMDEKESKEKEEKEK